MKRRAVFVVFKLQQANSIAIRRREPLTPRFSYPVPKSKVSKTARTSPSTRWLLLALALIGGNAEARPNHWLTWKQGVIRSVDPQRKSLTIAENDNKAVEVFRWNSGTRLLDQATERGKSGRPIDQGALTSGKSVKILFQNERGERVAKRIVINTSDNKHGSKTIQAVGR